MPKPVSKKQAAFFGAIAGGAVKKKGFSAEEAKDRLRGTDVSELPEKAGEECSCDCESCKNCESKEQESPEEREPGSRMERRGRDFASARKKMRIYMGKPEPEDEEMPE